MRITASQVARFPEGNRLKGVAPGRGRHSWPPRLLPPPGRRYPLERPQTFPHMPGLPTRSWGIPRSGKSLMSGCKAFPFYPASPTGLDVLSTISWKEILAQDQKSVIHYRKWPSGQWEKSLTEEPRASGSNARSSNYRQRIQERIAPGSTLALLLQRAQISGKSFPSLSPGFLFLRRDYRDRKSVV